MMFQGNILNDFHFHINKDIIHNILKIIDRLIPKKQNGTLNIIFLSENEIKNLNKNYRNIDSVTDVLSFHYFEDFENVKNNTIAGELIFCEEKIKIQAEEYGLGEEKEFYKLFIHSILHILWYDHEKENEYEIMQNLENQIWDKLFEKKQ